MIRLMVIDDHEIVRSGMVRMIRGTEIQLIAESNSGENILEGIAQYHPDVILLDVRMEGGDGLTALGRAKVEYPKIPVLIRILNLCSSESLRCVWLFIEESRPRAYHRCNYGSLSGRKFVDSGSITTCSRRTSNPSHRCRRRCSSDSP